MSYRYQLYSDLPIKVPRAEIICKNARKPIFRIFEQFYDSTQCCIPEMEITKLISKFTNFQVGIKCACCTTMQTIGL